MLMKEEVLGSIDKDEVLAKVMDGSGQIMVAS